MWSLWKGERGGDVEKVADAITLKMAEISEHAWEVEIGEVQGD